MGSDRQKFYVCRVCGNLIGVLHDAGSPLICCGEQMKKLVPNQVREGMVAHYPSVKVDRDTVLVEVGSFDHPMSEEHFIEWIYLMTDSGGQRKCLRPGEYAGVEFTLSDDRAIAAYVYCNLHGLWKTDV